MDHDEAPRRQFEEPHRRADRDCRCRSCRSSASADRSCVRASVPSLSRPSNRARHGPNGSCREWRPRAMKPALWRLRAYSRAGIAEPGDEERRVGHAAGAYARRERVGLLFLFAGSLCAQRPVRHRRPAAAPRGRRGAFGGAPSSATGAEAAAAAAAAAARCSSMTLVGATIEATVKSRSADHRLHAFGQRERGDVQRVVDIERRTDRPR